MEIGELVDQEGWLEELREKSVQSSYSTVSGDEDQPPLKGGLIDTVRYICEYEGWPALWKGEADCASKEPDE
jgi:hypothetical protein